MLQIHESQSNTFPKVVVSADGISLDLEYLTKFVHVVLVTVSSLHCPIGPQLLRILKFIGLENDDPNRTFTDPFTGTILTTTQEDLELNRILLRYDTLFLILLPGSLQEVSDAKLHYNIANHSSEMKGRIELLADGELNLAHNLGLTMSNSYIHPAIFHIRPNTLHLNPIKIGLSPGYYGYHSLISFLTATRLEIEVRSLNAVVESETRIEELDRRRGNGIAIYYPTFGSTKSSIFPNEIMENIFYFLSTKELERVSKLSDEWHHIAIYVWRNKVSRITNVGINTLPK
ncbi:hypothetical protein K7432_014958, partial [Basidiobolus ranarum]